MTESDKVPRRQILGYGVVAGGVVAATGSAMAGLAALARITEPARASEPAVRGRQLQVGSPPDAPGALRWSDPTSWGGPVPGPASHVSIDKPIVLDVDVRVGSLTIQPGGALIFDRGSSRTLSTTGNVVVLGVLQMRPLAGDVRHALRFDGIDESRFVGGGMDVAGTDLGVWCMGNGLLDIAGSAKTAWIRTAAAVARGASSISLDGVPDGWRVGDEVAIAPSGPNGHDAYDYASITSISRNKVGLSAATKHSHPVVDVGPGMRVAPEVLNLSRNVSIEGTSEGRSHITIMSGQRQSMEYFVSRWMGPRRKTSEFTAPVTGRYALHFHMMGNRSRGTRVTGAVVRDAGSHAYVAHESHGVTFTSCISHNTFDDAYWWDPREFIGAPSPQTHDASYIGCVASLVRTDPPFRGYRLAGFNLGAGRGNRVLDCVAIGVQGNRNASGFLWPEGSQSVWDFERCISHNNKMHGIFVWQNTAGRHVIENFVCADNGGAGISHGAYRTGYQYRDGYLFRNRAGGVHLHANSRADVVQRFIRLHCDSDGRADHAFSMLKHTLDPLHPTEIIGCTFLGQRKQAVAMTHDGGDTTRELLDIVECASSTDMLWLNDTTKRDSVIRVQENGKALRATAKSSTGTPMPEWNAVVNSISKFSSEPAGQKARPFSLLSAAATPA